MVAVFWKGSFPLKMEMDATKASHDAYFIAEEDCGKSWHSVIYIYI